MKRILMILAVIFCFCVAGNAQVRTITDDQWTSLEIKRPVVIDFYADWCGPCRALAPTFDRLAREYSGRIDFYRINVDNDSDYFYEYGGEGIPFLVFVYWADQNGGGIELFTETGYMEESELRSKLNTLLRKWNENK